MDLVRISRMLERDVFWALVGTLLAVVLVRFLLLFASLDLWILVALLLIGGWSGVFLSHYSQRSDDALFDSLRAQTPKLRSLCLKIMLWLLGTAAVIGVLTVLTASYEVLGRLSGTVFATALAAGMLWPLSLMIDRPKSQAAGFLGMASVIVVYCLVLPLIWELDSSQDEISLLSLVIGLTAPIGMAALLLVPHPKTHLSGRLGIAIYILAFASFCAAIWHPGGWRPRENWWLIGLCLCAYGTIAVVCLMDQMPTYWRDWRRLGVLASVIAWSIVVSHIWSDQSSPPPEKIITLFTSIAIFVAHASLMLLLPLGPGMHWLRFGTITALGTTTVFLNLELLFAPERGISLLGRIAGAGGVLASCGTLASLIAARLVQRTNPKRLSVSRTGEFTQITLICPACSTQQKLATGSGVCANCGIQIAVMIGSGPGTTAS